MKSKGHHPSSQVTGLLEAVGLAVAWAEWALPAYGTSSKFFAPFTISLLISEMRLIIVSSLQRREDTVR